MDKSVHLLGSRRIRCAFFGSFYRGQAVLRELVTMKNRGSIDLVGICSDDPSQSFVSPMKRVWQYPHQRFEEELVADEAAQAGMSVFQGKVKTTEFYSIFENEWCPDICFMATFGQKIDARLFSFPRLGFFNLHPSFDDAWPSYPGGNPFSEMIRDGKSYCVISMHLVDEGFDTGKLISRSPRIIIPKNASIIDLHKLTAVYAGFLVRNYCEHLLRLPETINS